MDEIKQSYINRNAKIIRQFLNLLSEGKVTREATEIVAREQGLSKGIVHAVFFNREYSNAAQAWAIIHKEEEEKEERERTANGTAKAVAGEVATA